jgi:Xaa-Pro aminopeptidase
VPSTADLAAEYAVRRRRLREVCREGGCNAFLATSGPGVRYLTGFTGSNGWVLVRPRSCALITDVRYRTQAPQEAPGCRTVITAGPLHEELVRLLAAAGPSTLGFEDETLTVAVHAVLRRRLHPVRLVPASNLLMDLRARKSVFEIGAIRRAAAITVAVFADILPLLRPGATEIEIAAEITHLQRRRGADGDAFPPIVLGGARSALVHGQPTARRFRAGDAVLVDFGCRAEGYCSDMTRTVAIGHASQALRNAHAAVREAQEAGLAALRPGAVAREVDAAARTVLARLGYGDRFEHALGHGLGLDIHERPLLSPRGGMTMDGRMTVTVEPGVYIPGRFGVRIEDTVVAGGDNLTAGATRDLLIL